MKNHGTITDQEKNETQTGKSSKIRKQIQKIMIFEVEIESSAKAKLNWKSLVDFDVIALKINNRIS